LSTYELTKVERQISNTRTWPLIDFSCQAKYYLPFMEPEVSLPCSQYPATGPCPESDKSNLRFPLYFFKIRSDIILPSTPTSSEVVSSLQLSDKTFYGSYMPARFILLGWYFLYISSHS